MHFVLGEKSTSPNMLVQLMLKKFKNCKYCFLHSVQLFFALLCGGLDACPHNSHIVRARIHISRLMVVLVQKPEVDLNKLQLRLKRVLQAAEA